VASECFYDARASEPNSRTDMRKDHVSRGRIRRVYPSGGRMSEDSQCRNSGSACSVHCFAGARHLEERVEAFLSPRSTRRYYRHKRKSPRTREGKGFNNAVSVDYPHGTTHE
jgi:hypothetical protein